MEAEAPMLSTVDLARFVLRLAVFSVLLAEALMSFGGRLRVRAVVGLFLMLLLQGRGEDECEKDE